MGAKVNEIVKKLSKLYETLGYASAKSSFDEWLAEKKDITQKDEATVKLFMARLCLAADKLDDLSNFFNAGMSSAEREELENLRQRNSKLEELSQSVYKELESLRAEVAKLRQENYDLQGQAQKYKKQGLMDISEVSDKVVQVGRYVMMKGYWLPEKVTLGDINKVLSKLPKLAGYSQWRLLSEGEYDGIKLIMGSKSEIIFSDCYMFGSSHYSLDNISDNNSGYICPVCERL